MEDIEPNLGRRVKFGGLPTLGIHRCVSILSYCSICVRDVGVFQAFRNELTIIIPTMKDPRLPVFALTLISMEGLDQGCDRRVESDFNTDSY